jgi:hypothetical protein
VDRIGHRFVLKPLSLAFCNLKSKFLFNLKIKYQQFNGKEDLSTDSIFDPCYFSLDYTFNMWENLSNLVYTVPCTEVYLLFFHPYIGPPPPLLLPPPPPPPPTRLHPGILEWMQRAATPPPLSNLCSR